MFTEIYQFAYNSSGGQPCMQVDVNNTSKVKSVH